MARSLRKIKAAKPRVNKRKRGSKGKSKLPVELKNEGTALEDKLAVSAEWTEDKTLVGNYRAMGLLLDANAGVRRKISESRRRRGEWEKAGHKAGERTELWELPGAVDVKRRAKWAAKGARAGREKGESATGVGSVASGGDGLEDELSGSGSEGESEDDVPGSADGSDGSDVDLNGSRVPGDLDPELRAALGHGPAEGPAPPRALTPRQRAIMQALVSRHGDDASAMAKDIKLNRMQHSEGKLRALLRSFQAGRASGGGGGAFRAPVKKLLGI